MVVMNLATVSWIDQVCPLLTVPPVTLGFKIWYSSFYPLY